MKQKTTFITLMLFIILFSGCVAINIGTDKTQQSSPITISNPVKTTKNIDTSQLDMSKIVLTDAEIREVIGSDWIKQDVPSRGGAPGVQFFITEYINPNTYYKNTPTIDFMIIIAPNSTIIKQALDNISSNREFGKIATISDLDIGDSGKLIKSKNYQNNNMTIIVFNINTILVETIASPDQDNAINLARKQESKIKNIINSLN